MTTQTKSIAERFRALRFQLRRLWKLPDGCKTTPALFGIIILTMSGAGVTLSSWVMVRLLPSVELIRSLAAEFPNDLCALLRRLPELLAEAPPSTAALTEVLVSSDAYIITYACGVATAFCFLLLVVALLRRW
ncbi:MAG: hypothetical protein RR049_03695 [Angelakisella sp.]